MATKFLVRKNDYHDSMVLMQINYQVSAMNGIKRAAIMMGTENNKILLSDYGFTAKSIEEAKENDLIVCLEADNQEILYEAYFIVKKLLKETAKRVNKKKRFMSLESACKSFQDANLAIISVPGQFAFREANKALSNNLNVFLFSDNVCVEEEIELKQLAREKNLLLMGPDCGTAIINGVGLGFANSVNKGPVGIVGASGTGCQELCVILERFGNLGVSHVIGIGSRDLSEPDGGIGAFQSLELLDQDSETRCIIFISKLQSKRILRKVYNKMQNLSKPVVACFIGIMQHEVPIETEKKNILIADNIQDAALKAIKVLKGNINRKLFMVSKEIECLIQKDIEKLKPTQKFVRAIFSGGSFCYESMSLLNSLKYKLYSNIKMTGIKKLSNSHKSLGNTFVDMGEDEFTKGRVHPMIDPIPIAKRIRDEAKDPTVAVILFDVILGYGTHPDPASILAPAVKDAKEEAKKNKRKIIILTHVCGTERDLQDREKQEKQLQEAGAFILPTNIQATKLIAVILRGDIK